MAESSGRSQVQGVIGLNGSKIGKKLSTPKGYGAVSGLFADIARHFGGSWFDGLADQDDYRRRAVRWAQRLQVFQRDVVDEAMAEVVSRGDFAAPSLDTIFYLCQRVTDERSSVGSRESSREARLRARQEIAEMGVKCG